MKKKILMVCLIILLVLVPVTAKSYKGATADNQLGVGLNLGTNCGVGLKYGMGKFDIVGNVGFGVLNMDLELDAEVSYEVYDFQIKGPHHIPLTVGLGTYLNMGLGEGEFSLGVLCPIGIEYTLVDFPMNFYLRLAPGVTFQFTPAFAADFGWAANIGALYMFDL